MSTLLTPMLKPSAVLNDPRSTGSTSRPRLPDVLGLKGTLKR